ncbi:MULTISPECIES: hypothetical protein [unclassified Rhizobium]|uniref:hypothetical protein n=1 Tax=Rhizobium TaxID=379 RepID=UPI00084CA540|nr:MULTISPECIES: hypothetical protein [unclassified Rhizobium]OEC95555.1 hypothetical protein A9Z06_30790 [Rhizobium sp. YK2]QYA15169.1 hypothetical protein J5284_25405 [Rhizobium sp. AB2/73]UEQ83964.1 hypothetical protein I8E17_21745 [Rhizobium sp. AB2/73]
MLTLRNAFLISAGLIIATGLASQAVAQQKIEQSANTHQMTVRLPDGSLELIRYSGAQPPTITFRDDPASMAGFSPFDDISPFADIERISAAMDREAAALMNDPRLFAPWPDGSDNLMKIDLSKLPAGVKGYTVISTTSGKGTCTQTVEYFSSGSGKPRVEKTSSGSCGPAQSPATRPAHAIAPQPSPSHQPSNVIQASFQPDTKTVRLAGLF